MNNQKEEIKDSVLQDTDDASKPCVISVEGNIGGGKSTLLNFLSHNQNFEILTEPIEEWRNINNQNLFLFYR